MLLIMKRRRRNSLNGHDIDESYNCQLTAVVSIVHFQLFQLLNILLLFNNSNYGIK